PCQGVGVGNSGAEQGQLGLGRSVQDRAASLTLRADQLLALLMHDVDDRAEPQQVLIPGVAADLGTALARGSIAELITDRIPEVPGDVQLVGCLPGPGRGDLDGVVVLVADPRPLDGDLAEGRLEGERPRPPALDTSAGFAAAVLQDQLLVGLLDGLGRAGAGSEGRPDGRTPRSGRGGARPGTARAGTSPATAAARRPDRPCGRGRG